MSAGRRLWGACNILALRPRPAVRTRTKALWQPRVATRFFSDDVDNNSGKPDRPIETSQAPIDSEPPIRAPVASENIVQDSSFPEEPEKKAQESSSETAQESEAQESEEGSYISKIDDASLERLMYGGRVATSPKEGGLTAAQEEVFYREGFIPPAEEAEAIRDAGGKAEDPSKLVEVGDGEVMDPGHKFGLPAKPYPAGFNLKQRYHPVLEQLSRLLMRDGKLSVAQRNLAMIMNFLRTSPAPIYSPKFPLLPGSPPASHLPLNPILYITLAIDSVAPLLKIKAIPGAGGGGRALDVPQPLAVRQRRHTAFKWILEAVEKKPSKGSGRKQLPYRIGEEIIAVIEGRSSAWEKRRQVHKLGTASRANVGSRKILNAKRTTR